MFDFLKLLGVETGTGGLIEIGTVEEYLGNNKYSVSIRGNIVTAISAASAAVRIHGQAVLSKTVNGWYIMGQPKNAVSSERIEVVVSG
jgi:hypothetical protein